MRKVNDLWPEEYQAEVGSAIQAGLSYGVEEALVALKMIETKFAGHEAFRGREDDLKKSIVRNTILALSLSNESKSKLALQRMLESPRSLDIFSPEERSELIHSIQGKLSRTMWQE